MEGVFGKELGASAADMIFPMRRHLFRWFVLLLLGAPTAGIAQSGTAAASIREFYATLGSRSDAELASLVGHADPLQAGFARLEMHKRTNSLEHASEAARKFSLAVKTNSDDAWAHFGLALTLTRAKKTMAIVRSMGAGDGEATPFARRTLQKALALDPTLVEASDLISEMARPSNKARQRYEQARADSADAALARQPTTSVEYLQHARALFLAGDKKAGADAYFKALSIADDAAMNHLVGDISILANPQELITVTQGDLAKRIDKMQLFWKKRAVRDGVSPSERVAEHYRRVNFALDWYGQPGVPVTNAWGKRRQGLEAQIDDRGLIYVRFGPPYEKNGIASDETMRDIRAGGLETWAYLDPDGRWRVYFFVGRRLEDNPMTGVGGANQAAALDLLRKYDPRYGFIAARMESNRINGIMGRAGSTNTAFIAENNRHIAEVMRRIVEKNFATLFAAFDMDEARPPYSRPLTLYSDVATFRGKGCTDIVYSVATPASSYRLNIAVADTFTWEAQGIDTTVTGTLFQGEYLRATGVLCSPPDYNSYIRISASSDSTTGVTGGGELRIPDYSGKSLMISDMLFGRDETGPFVRGDVQLSLVPPRQFKEGERFKLFYELYNLPAGRKYKTEITFRTIEGNVFAKLFKGTTTTTITFEETSERGDLIQAVRTLVPQIEAGETEVRIKVTDLTTGEIAENKKKIFIIPPQN